MRGREKQLKTRQTGGERAESKRGKQKKEQGVETES